MIAQTEKARGLMSLIDIAEIYVSLHASLRENPDPNPSVKDCEPGFGAGKGMPEGFAGIGATDSRTWTSFLGQNQRVRQRAYGLQGHFWTGEQQ